MKRFCPLASGSKGNSLYLSSGKTNILIDAGLSARNLTKRLNEIDVDITDIDAILITHEHSDHIRGLAQLACKMGIPVFANSDTARAIVETLRVTPKFRIFSTGEPFSFGEFDINPFSIQHDAIDPVGFAIQIGDTKLGLCADLGFVTPLVQSHLLDADYLYLESNHQVEMVHACPRPAVYKKRVLGRLGHLSNDQCRDLLRSLLNPKLKHVYLAHLSSECNNPDLAAKVVTSMIEDEGASCTLSIAHQDVVSEPILL